eukprot:RCo049172
MRGARVLAFLLPWAMLLMLASLGIMLSERASDEGLSPSEPAVSIPVLGAMSNFSQVRKLPQAEVKLSALISFPSPSLVSQLPSVVSSFMRCRNRPDPAEGGRWLSQSPSATEDEDSSEGLSVLALDRQGSSSLVAAVETWRR